MVLDKENDNCPKPNDISTVKTNVESPLVKDGINDEPFDTDVHKDSCNKPQHVLIETPTVVQLCDRGLEQSPISVGLQKRKNSTSSDDSFYSMEEVDCSTDNCLDLDKNKVIQEKKLTKSNTDAVGYVLNKVFKLYFSTCL